MVANERGQIGGFSQKWKRIHTRVDANGFRIYSRGCERFCRARWVIAELTPSGAGKDLAGQTVKLAGSP